MTNEEAIAWLEHHFDPLPDGTKQSEAVSLAIKALETIPKYKDAYNKGWDDGAKATYEHLKMCEEEQDGDLISRQRAISLADELKDDLPDDDHLADMVLAHNEGILEYQKQLSLLPSVNPQEPKWIPVSSGRLPEKYTYTLWCASSGYVRSDYFNGEFWEDAKKYCYKVIAWMPLPKPYEPQTESEGEE